jgi:hypothetical protein
MSSDLEFDVDRYRKLLAEATDDEKRLALIELLIEERAKTAAAIVRVLGISKT